MWVRLRTGIISADPDEASFQQLESAVLDPENALEIKRQDTVDEKAIELMALPENIKVEMKKTFPCATCDGSGKLWVAVRNTYGFAAGYMAKVESEKNQRKRQLKKMNAAKKLLNADAEKNIKKKNKEEITEEHRRQEDPGNTNNSFKGPSFFANDPMVGATKDKDDEDDEDDEGDEGNQDNDDDETTLAPKSMFDCWSCCGSGSSRGSLDSVMDYSIVNNNETKSGGETKGSGEINSGGSSKKAKKDPNPHVEAAMEFMKTNPTASKRTLDKECRKYLAKTFKLSMGKTYAIVKKAKVLIESEFKLEEEKEPVTCLICYSNPPKYGISTSCSHFFCVDCIQGHLKQIQASGSFPGYCPICESSAPLTSGGQSKSEYGRIDGRGKILLLIACLIVKKKYYCLKSTRYR